MDVPHLFDPLIFGTEIAFTIIAVVFCFIIYFRTKESYDLTKYEGIKYFRDAFLFFGLSYVLRFLFGVLLLSRIAFDFSIPRDVFVPFFILPLGYFSTIGIFYLVFSLVWKRFTEKKMLIFGHGSAIILSAVAFMTRSHFILLYLQCALLVGAAALSFLTDKFGKKISRVKAFYLLVSGLWLMNLLVVGRRRPFPLEIGILFEVVSLIVFVVIYHKISKWVQ